MKKTLFILRTRPEAIKLASLIKEFKKYESLFTVYGSELTLYYILNFEHRTLNKLCT